VDRLLPFNRALFESWTVVLSRQDETRIVRAAADIRENAREAMAQDGEYIAAITASTGDRRRVRMRFTRATELVEDALRAG
jgi:hypothetical protein